MKKNNKNASVAVILIIIIIIGALLYIFLPKDIFSKSKSSNFGSFTNDKRYKNDGVPAPLKWKKSFAYDKKEEKQQGSYMRYMIDKNNAK